MGVQKSCKAAIQISHGMAEHSGRYQDLGNFLAEKGFAVYAHDHRDHGRSVSSPQQLGFCAPHNGWRLILEDMLALTRHMEEKHPGVPIFLLGHSFGTLLSLNYTFCWANKINGMLLSGLSSCQPILSIFGLIFSFIQSSISSKKTKSPFLNNLLFGGYNKHFKPARTDFDWLCSDPAVVDRYIEDQHCGAIFSAGFFYDLANASIEIHRTKNFKKIPSNLPIIILCGENDPVGNMVKGAEKVCLALKRAGIKDIVFKAYKGCRHEILNEKIKDEVYKDILYWINAHL